jgi:hypothetical protein
MSVGLLSACEGYYDTMILLYLWKMGEILGSPSQSRVGLKSENI